MNKYIKEQLNKCKVAVIPEFDDNTTELLISSNNCTKVGITGITTDFYVGMECNIEVEDYIIHPYPGFTLHDNWNCGIIPTDKYMHITVVKEMAKMICIQAIGLNDNKSWGGWLPKKSCKII